MDSSEVAYTYGHLGTAGVEKDGDAKGAFYEGENGVIEIEVPPSHGGKPGKWSDASLFSAYVRQQVNTQTDEAPDAGETFVYRGTTCQGGGPTGPSGPTGPTGPAPGPTGPVTPATGPLRVTVTPLTFKAKRVKKVKKIAFNVRPSESMTGVVLALKKAKKTLGSAKIGELQGAKTVKVKLRKKGLKKGRYAVLVTAKRPTGATATKTFKVSMK